MQLPSHVGRFEVRNEIAQGGFAIVLRAWDEDLETHVAIKILRPQLALDTDLQHRFLEEARMLRRIRSPNVVTVYDVGRLNDGRPYFVMDFAERGTLADRLLRNNGASSSDRQSMWALVDALADGLSAIHEAGVVHRDIKPANILLQMSRRKHIEPEATALVGRHAQSALIDVDERILVGDFGIAKDLIKHPMDTTMVGGTPLYRAPEQQNPRAEITPAADIYAATAMLWHVRSGEPPPDSAEVLSRANNLPTAWREVIQQGMAIDPNERFASIENWRNAVQRALAEETENRNGQFLVEQATGAAQCPYKGLEAYQPEDADFFFGREALTDELLHRMRMHKVLVVGGASGSGKSSLVRAGLIPALSADALPDSKKWSVVLMTPGRDPLAELYFQLTSKLPPGSSSVSLDELAAHPALARHLGGASTSGTPLVLCIDQFEEAFTLSNESRRAKFVEALSAMTDPADSRVCVIITVRADFYGACGQIPWLARRITDNQVLVGPMTSSELRRAIIEPARRLGLNLEPGLVDLIVDEAGSEVGSLPLVAHALVETWLRRKGNTMTVEAFREAGGVTGAISQTAETTFDRYFDETEQAAAKRLFLRLVSPGDGTPETRRILEYSDIEHDSQPVVMRRIVERLTEARLLTVDDKFIQIAHEALLRTWPRLRAWIEESRDDLRMRQRIHRAAVEWSAEGRESDLLYRGTPLLTALEWDSHNPSQLGELEREFLEISSETKAREEAIATQRAQRARRMRFAAIAGLAVLALGATGASVAAYVAKLEADSNAKEADLARAEAHERLASTLGAVAHGLVDKDPLLALVLGAEAVARAETPSFDARAAMLAARQALAKGGPFLLRSAIPVGDAQAIAISPRGELLAAGQRNGDIDMIELATGERVGPILRGHEGGVRDLDFSPDGRWLTSASVDGTVWLWPVAERFGEPGRKIGVTNDLVSGVSYSPDGTSVASANGDGTVMLWNVTPGLPSRPPLVKYSHGFQSVQFAPDGRSVVAGGKDGTIHGWALPSGKPLFEPIHGAHTSKVLQTAFMSDLTRIATASTDGTSVVLTYPEGRILGRAFPDDVRIDAVAFAPKGSILIGGDHDGALQLWDIERKQLVGTSPRGHSQAIVEAVTTRDGRLLATLGADQQVRLWDVATRYPVESLRRVAGRAAKGLAFSADGHRLAAGDDTGIVQLWTLNGDEMPIRLLGHRQQVWAVAFSPDGSLLASGDRAGQVRIWKTANGGLLSSFAADTSAVWSVGFTPDGERLVTATDQAVRLWNVKTGSILNTIRHEGGRITRAAISPNGREVAVSTTDGTIKLWALDEAKLVREFAADKDVVWTAAFSPDGKRLATGSSDEVVSLWDVATGQRLANLTGHTGGATDVGFLGDGATVVAVDRHGMVHIWDLQTGQRLFKAWQGHAQTSWRIAVHPDGERFATAGDDGTVKLWDQLSVARACEIGRNAFDASRQRRYLGEGKDLRACADRGRPMAAKLP